MKSVIFLLLFLFCNGNVGALERSKDSEVLLEKTKEVMDEVNKVNNLLQDFYNNLKDAQVVHNDGIKKSPDEIRTKPYVEQSKSYGDSTNHPEQRQDHGESMRLYYELQDRHHELQNRFADLQTQSQNLKKLREQLVGSKYDKSIYEKYIEEQKNYNELLSSYKKDLSDQNEMKKKHDDMKRMLRAN